MCLVSHIIDYLGYARGGAETNVEGLCRHNTNPQFRFEVITSRSPFIPPDFSGVHVPIRTAVGFYHIQEYSFLFNGMVSDLLYRLPKIVFQHNIRKLLTQSDIIHSHSLNILELMSRYQIRVPTVLTIYNPLPARYFSSLDLINRVIVRTQRLLAEMEMTFPKHRSKFIYIPPGCEFSIYRSDVDDHNNQRSLMSREEIKLLLVGRLRPFKNIEGLIAAMKILMKDSKFKYSLTVVGGGPRLRQLIRMSKSLGVSSKIKFLGTFPTKLMGSIYRSHDVVIAPSLYESFSQVSMEALVAGKRLLISEEMKEFIRMFPTIPTCNPHSPQDIAEKIMQVVREKAPNISINDLRGFNWSDVIKLHYDVYNKLSIK